MGMGSIPSRGRECLSAVGRKGGAGIPLGSGEVTCGVLNPRLLLMTVTDSFQRPHWAYSSGRKAWCVCPKARTDRNQLAINTDAAVKKQRAYQMCYPGEIGSDRPNRSPAP